MGKENNEKKVLINSITSLMSISDSDKLLYDSIRLLKPSRRRMAFLCAFFVIGMITYPLIFIQYINAIEHKTAIVNMVNIFAIPVFAIIITGYAIFQALVNGNTLIALLKVSEEDKSKFQVYNQFFFIISIMYLFIIILNNLIKVLLISLPQEWQVTLFTTEINNFLFSLIVVCYLTFIINAVIEIKSFIFNLHQIFTINATAEGIKYLEQERER